MLAVSLDESIRDAIQFYGMEEGEKIWQKTAHLVAAFCPCIVPKSNSDMLLMHVVFLGNR